MSCPRIGHINFLNVLPLTYSYKHGYSNGLSIKYDMPSVLNSDIKNNRLDISPISSIEYARMYDELLILPNICIRAENDVESIVLISKKPIECIKNDRIVLTSKSATSHCLLKIILSEYYGAKPVYDVQNIDVNYPILDDAVASLFIGDDALQIYLNIPKNLYCYDLGREWHKFTGQSMVYALWVVRKDFVNKSPALLQFAYDKIINGMKNGLKNITEIINYGTNVTNINYNDINKYFSDIIKWDLNDKDINSLTKYYEYAYKLKLIEKIPNIKFANVKKISIL